MKLLMLVMAVLMIALAPAPRRLARLPIIPASNARLQIKPNAMIIYPARLIAVVPIAVPTL